MANPTQTNGNGNTDTEAGRAADSIGAGVERIGESARATTRRARDELQRGGDQINQEVGKGYQAVKEVATEYADRGEMMLRDQVERAPMQSLAIAVGVGFLLAHLLRR